MTTQPHGFETPRHDHLAGGDRHHRLSEVGVTAAAPVPVLAGVDPERVHVAQVRRHVPAVVAAARRIGVRAAALAVPDRKRETVRDRVRIAQPAIERRRLRARRDASRATRRRQARDHARAAAPSPRRPQSGGSPTAARASRPTSRRVCLHRPPASCPPRRFPPAAAPCAGPRWCTAAAAACSANAPSPSPPTSSMSGGASGSGLGRRIPFTHSRHCFSVNVASLRSNVSVCGAYGRVLLVGQPAALVRLAEDPADVLVPLRGAARRGSTGCSAAWGWAGSTRRTPPPAASAPTGCLPK